MEFEVGSLSAHCQAQYGKERPPQWVTLLATAYISIHRVSFPKSVGSIRCPVGGYKGGWVMMCINLRIHFVHYHVQDTVVIL